MKRLNKTAENNNLLINQAKIVYEKFSDVNDEVVKFLNELENSDLSDTDYELYNELKSEFGKYNINLEDAQEAINKFIK